mgnify:FL=1
MKHIEVRYHHIWELVIDKKLEIRKVDTEVKVANSLAKPLPNSTLLGTEKTYVTTIGERKQES